MFKSFVLSSCMFMFGCYSSFITEGEADASIDSHADTEADTILDSSVEDTSTDTVFDVDVLDSPDLVPDSPPDTSEPLPCQPAPGGECNIIEQCECPEGHWCKWVLDFSTCRFFERCVASDPGHIAPGHDCSPLGSEYRCVPGSYCDYTICVEWCRNDLDCTVSGSTCSESSDMYFPEGSGDCSLLPVSFPYMFCSR
jgi:hypothetical protein